MPAALEYITGNIFKIESLLNAIVEIYQLAYKEVVFEEINMNNLIKTILSKYKIIKEKK